MIPARQLKKAGKSRNGFTMIEIIAVLVLIGIVTAVITTRFISVDSSKQTAFVSAVKNQIRYVQTMAMKNSGNVGGTQYWGIKCNGLNYWLFKGGDPDVVSGELLPGEESVNVSLSAKGVTMSGFVLFFDRYGIPYSGSVGSIVKITAPLTVTVGSHAFSVTPETGFIQ